MVLFDLGGAHVCSTTNAFILHPTFDQLIYRDIFIYIHPSSYHNDDDIVGPTL